MVSCEVCGMEKPDVRMSADMRMNARFDVEGYPLDELIMCDVCRKKNRADFDKLRNEMMWVSQ